uniref:Uncharacterized protein n=1 Tax=Glossina palpalis gambiensis TaxID=67801 RepID=A0A1B0BFH6_9MUSC
MHPQVTGTAINPCKNLIVCYYNLPTNNSKLATDENVANICKLRILKIKNNGNNIKHMCRRTSKTTEYSSIICFILSAMKTT